MRIYALMNPCRTKKYPIVAPRATEGHCRIAVERRASHSIYHNQVHQIQVRTEQENDERTRVKAVSIEVAEQRVYPALLRHHNQFSGLDEMVLGSPVETPSPSDELDEGEIASDGEIKYETGKKTSITEPVFNLSSPNKRQQPIDMPIKHLESIHDSYDLDNRPFARGKFAQVKRCINKSSKECFAAKCIKKRRRLIDTRQEILLEIEALKLSYLTDRIVKLYEVYETPSEMILVLEMANGGELQRVLDEEECLDEQLVKRMLGQILEALIYLHDQNIAHLDIKPQNLLLTESLPKGSIKLCDFGISRRISKDCEIREICGTPDYVAPEILSYDPISLATDMWSLGVLTYVLLSGYSPFGSENKQQTFCNITQADLDFPSEIFATTSREAIDFIQKLIVREPTSRLTSRQAKNHPWLATVRT